MCIRDRYQGNTYHFCATSCLTKFRNDPIHYLTPPEQRAPLVMPVPSGGVIEYICPMDPEVLETQPGACRICGMALEPKVLSLIHISEPTRLLSISYAVFCL